MSELVGTQRLASGETDTFSIDWSPYLLGAETISGVSWTVPSVLTTASTTNSSTVANIRLTAGGTIGETYQIECAITTSNSNTRKAHFTLTVTK